VTHQPDRLALVMLAEEGLPSAIARSPAGAGADGPSTGPTTVAGSVATRAAC